jgi:hypothetical protein
MPGASTPSMIDEANQGTYPSGFARPRQLYTGGRTEFLQQDR